MEDFGILAKQAATIDPTRTHGVKKVLLMRVNFADDAAALLSESDGVALLDQVNQFYREASYGQFSITATVTSLLTLPQTKSFYKTNSQTYLTLLADARAIARNAGVDPNQFDLDLAAFIPIYPEFNGNANVGAKGAWLQTKAPGTAIHELGHNLGLFHANTWNAYGDSMVGEGYNLEYGNSFDVMGVSQNRGQFNAVYKNLLGWFPKTNVLTVVSNGVYKLDPYDLPTLKTGANYALVIKKDQQRSYWLESRKQNALTNSSLAQGILLNWAPWEKSLNGSDLIDVTPSSSAGFDDAALQIGRTFVDSTANIFVTPLRKNGDVFDIAVNFGPFPTNRAPALTLNAVTLGTLGTIKITNILSNPIALPGVPVTLLAVPADPDNDSMAFFWDFGDGTVSTNSNLVLKSWAQEGDYRIRCTATDLKGGTASTSLLLRVGNPTTFRISGKVTQSGRALAEVRVSLGSARVGYTDTDGRFTFTGITPGDYVVTPGKPGFSFTSAYATASVANADVTIPDFTAKSTNLLNNTPLVEVVAPKGEFVFAPGGRVELTAKVTDDGQTSAVSFFEDGNLLGSAAAGNTNLSWTVPTAGDHRVIAGVTDENGAIGQSAPWIVHVLSAPAGNDNFANALPITQAPVRSFNVLATSELSEPRHGNYPGDRSVWFTWSATQSSAAVVKVSGQIRDSVIAVYTGDTLQTLVSVASRIGSSSNEVSFSASPGTTYRIAVKDASENPGSFTIEVITTAAPAVALTASPQNPPVTAAGASVELTATASDSDGIIARVEFYNGIRLIGSVTEPPYRLSLTNLGVGNYALRAVAVDNNGATTEATVDAFRVPPANDDFANAIPFTGFSSNLVGTSDGAGRETGELGHAGQASGRSVWYSWTGPGKIGAVLILKSTVSGRILAVYEGGALTTLTNLAVATSASAAVPASLAFNAEAGKTYFIAVDDFFGEGAGFTLQLITTSLPTATLKATPNVAALPLGSNIQLQGSGFDSDGSISSIVFLDGKSIISSNSGSSATITVTNLGVGTHRFTAKTFDNLGAFGTSSVVTVRVPAVNDNFANRIQIESPGLFSGSNDGASKENFEPNHASYPGARSLWYTWTAPTNTAAVLTLTGEINFGILAAYIGNQLTALTNVAAIATTNIHGSPRLTFTAVAGTTYQIALDDASTGGGGAFELDFRTTAPPEITLSSSPTNGSTLTPGTSIQLDAIATDRDGSVAVVEFFEGKNLLAFLSNAPYALLVTNLLEGGLQITARATDNLGARTTTTAIELRIPPSNDDFANAAPIEGTLYLTGMLSTGGSREIGEPLPAGLNGGKSLWWNWTAPSKGPVLISTDGTDFDTIVVVYTGTNLSNLAFVAFDDDGGLEKASRVTFNASAGTTYRISVEGYEGAAGRIVLSLVMEKHAAIRSFADLADGSFKLEMLGPSAATNLLETSTDLQNWSPLLQSTNGAPYLRFTDPPTNRAPHRFYRNRRF